MYQELMYLREQRRFKPLIWYKAKLLLLMEENSLPEQDKTQLNKLVHDIDERNRNFRGRGGRSNNKRGGFRGCGRGRGNYRGNYRGGYNNNNYHGS